MNGLTEFEETELQRMETVIEHNLPAFIEVGEALFIIRERRLYRAKYATFEAYCTERWSFSRQHGHRMIEAAQIARSLSPVGDIPNERAARELAKVKEGLRPAVLAAAIEAAPDHVPTTPWVKAAAAVLETAVATDGFVDTGNGTMTPITAAITHEVYEAVQRQRQHITDSVAQRNGTGDRLASVTVPVADLRGVAALGGSLAGLDDSEVVRLVVYEIKNSEQSN